MYVGKYVCMDVSMQSIYLSVDLWICVSADTLYKPRHPPLTGDPLGRERLVIQALDGPVVASAWLHLAPKVSQKCLV